ncbi:hypothetical protein QF000_000496 [Paraburkholderia atlantica]|uniref:hypothetical protein n=1 Tax=Paraburkholderia atlantica TaxID=2654982 RepID=UPI003D1AAAEC
MTWWRLPIAKSPWPLPNVLDLYNERLELTEQAVLLGRKHLSPDAPALAQIGRSRTAVADLHASPALLDSPASFERFDVAHAI